MDTGQAALTHSNVVMQPILTGCQCRGRDTRRVAYSNSRPPPTPKVFEPVFFQFEVLGERVSAKGAEIFFFALPKEVIFLSHVPILKILRIL